MVSRIRYAASYTFIAARWKTTINAVYLIEDFLASTDAPPYEGVVDYGDRAEHCWNGDHDRPNAISRLRYHQMYVEKILQRIKQTAPPGADLTTWRY